MQESIEQKIVASAIQQQFWLLYQLQPDSPVYNMPSVFHIKGTLDRNRLEECCNSLYRQYDVLRTTYEAGGDTLYQVVHSYTPLRFTEEEISQSAAISLKIQEEMACPFDLEQGPLVRFRLLKTGENDCYFIITMHHIIADLRSNELFGEQLSSLYNGHDGEDRAKSAATSYAEYSVWQREWLSSEKYAKKFSFWKSVLEDNVGLISLPTDRPHPPRRSFKGGAVSVDIGASLTEKIRQFCLQDPYNNTLLTLLSAYACLLYRYTGQEKLRIGVPFTNRRKAGTNDTLGCFVNTLPIVVTLNVTATFTDVIGQLRETLGEAHRNQDVPLTAIDAAISGRHDPVFQTGFTLTHPMVLSLNGVAVEPLYLHNGGAQMDLFASFWETASKISGFLEFDADVYDEASVERMAAGFLRLLEAAVDNPSGQVGQYPLLSPEEWSVIVDGWSGYRPEYAGVGSLAKLFTDYTATTSNAVAPVADMRIYVLNSCLQPVPAGVAGELYVSGASVGKEYLNCHGLTDDGFITVSHLFGGELELLCRTGAIARWQKSGMLKFVCSAEDWAPVNGFFPEPAAIEETILKVPNVKYCSVVMGNGAIKGLVAYLVGDGNPGVYGQLAGEVRRYVATHLPACMHPSGYVVLDTMPLTVDGTLDRQALPQPDAITEEGRGIGQIAYTKEESRVADIWMRLLQIDAIPVDLSFFDASGTSLLAARLAQELQTLYGRKVPVALIFQYPTIRDLAGVLGTKETVQQKSRATAPVRMTAADDDDAVAVVGMACRFPGANSIEEYWQMLCRGEEHISFFEDGKIPADIDTSIRGAENYVRAKGLLDNVEMFDESFFGFNHQNAAATDPQIRLFLEHSYEAIENAGYTTDDIDNSVGVYAGMGRSLYLRYNILPRPDIVEQIGELQIELGHEKDHLPTRVSHSLNLTGPSISVSTACSTSLVAIIMAYQAILRGDCTMALAGGSNIYLPLYRGHLHQEGAFFSKDGHCRPFDVDSTGTTFSDGVGVVVLKKLSKALSDKNTIYAVVKGGALNNDGSKKVSYTAPGVEGQVGVVTAALQLAGVAADTIGYVETHGTATPLGDPIEIEALTQAYQRHTDRRQYCAIGSVKSNIGHTSIAAGVASFIKTVLMLHHKKFVPSLYFTKPNPAIDFESSPFYVSTEHRFWDTAHLPRRAAVSSFGFGGTNSHCILEEAPEMQKSGPSRLWQLLPFSAKSPEALERMVHRFGSFIKNAENGFLADAAYTLQMGRQRYPYRQSIVCATGTEASVGLSGKGAKAGANAARRDVPIVFMYPGQGNQYVNMGKAVYDTEKVYRNAFDRCAEAVRMEHYEDIRSVVFSHATEESHERLRNTYYAQTSIFATEYALSQLWLSWGVRPAALIGHSVGEFCAACVAGVMTLEDAAILVATRGMLMGKCKPGAMLSIRLPESEVQPLLTDKLSVAAVNSPQLCVVSGTFGAITALTELCASREIPCRPLHTSHAFHSAMMEPAVAEFADTVERIKLAAPVLPIISTVTGERLTSKLATDSKYWARHMRVTVRFSDAIAYVLANNTEAVFLEAGPRATCCTLARQQAPDQLRYPAISSLGTGHEPETEDRELIKALGELWKVGVEPDWNAFYRAEQRRIISLPTYPFEKRRHWIDPVVIMKQPQAAIYGSDSPATIATVGAQLEDKQTSETKADEIPEDPVTAAIKKMVADALGVPVVSLDGDATFLQLGMDSLFLTQMSQRVKTLFGVSVSMRHLMRTYSTISKLSTFVTEGQNK